MTAPKLGLVTVLFNSENVLPGFFASLGNQIFDEYHLYLIDNTPSEESAKLIRDLANKYNVSRYTHVENAKNVGVAEGNNQGIALSLKAGTTHTLLLNNDIEFEQADILNGLYMYALKHAEALIVPKILFYDTRKIWAAAGSLNYLTAVTSHNGEGLEDSPKYNLDFYSNYAPTCFMLVDNQVFDTVGLMDPKYFVYYDDTDFVYRATKVGLKVFYYSKYTVLHKVSSLTGGAESPFTVYWANRNRIYFVRKNYKIIHRIFTLFYTLTTRIYKYIRFDNLLKGKLLSGISDGFKINLK